MPVALVTGASAGLGREFARQLAQRGHDLILVARDAARLEAVAAEVTAGGRTRAEVVAADLSRDADVDRLVERLRGEPPDLLVNNAGFGTKRTLARTEPEPQERMLRLHVMAPMRLTQAVLPGMVGRGSGGVINVSSVASFVYSAGNVNYCATKAYLTVFSEGLALETRGSGVRVQALCPGFTHTEFHERMEFSKGQVPDWLWLGADRVVRTSLDQLERGGPVICIPGRRYQLLFGILRHVPRSWLGRSSRVHHRA